MANYNRVPEGRVGTGEAYILPESQALESLIDKIEYNQKMGLLNVKAKRDAQNALGKSYQDNQLKAKNGLLFNNELNGYLQKHIQKGAEYRAKGFDVYNPDPNRPDQMAAHDDYMKERSQLQSMMDLRDAHEKHYLSQLDEAQKGESDEDSVNALHDFYSDNGKRLYELQQSGASLPMLTKAFDPAEQLKQIEAASIKSNSIANGIETTRVIPNVAAIRYNVEQSFNKSPQAQRWLKKQVGSSPVPLMGTQDPAEITQFLSEYYTSPDGAEEVVKNLPKGVIPSSNVPEFQDFVKKKAKEQIGAEQRYNNVITELTKQKAAEVDQQYIKDYNFDLENQRFKREDQARQSRKEKEEDDAINQRDKFIQGLQTGNTEHVQRLRQLVQQKDKQGSVGYYTSGPNKGMMRIKWRERVGGKTVQQEKVVDPSELSEQSYTAFNELLNTVAGKKVPVETLLNKPGYAGGIVNIGDKSLKPEQIEKIRTEFGSDYKSLGEMLKKNGFFKTAKEAYTAAAQILDKKGKLYKMK